jgi:hypothetical protein
MRPSSGLLESSRPRERGRNKATAKTMRRKTRRSFCAGFASFGCRIKTNQELARSADNRGAAEARTAREGLLRNSPTTRADQLRAGQAPGLACGLQACRRTRGNKQGEPKESNPEEE